MNKIFLLLLIPSLAIADVEIPESIQKVSHLVCNDAAASAENYQSCVDIFYAVFNAGYQKGKLEESKK